MISQDTDAGQGSAESVTSESHHLDTMIAPKEAALQPPVPLAIIGMGCLFPRAKDTRSYWLNIKNAVDAIGPVPSTHWNPEEYLDADPKAPDRVYTARGGFLEPVDFYPLEYGIAPNDLEAIDTSQLLGLVATRQALEDAGYGSHRTFDRNRVSVILGVTGTLELVIPLGARLGHPRWKKALAEAGVDATTAKDVVDRIAESYVPWQENSFPGLLGNVVAGRIANRLDLGGTNCVVDAACASSLSAIHLAALELAAGRCDMAVTGGVDTFNDIFMYMCFSKTPALSPTGNAKPFDANGDGTILGEGLGIVVLKRLSDARRDGDRIYAVIRAIGTSSDGKGNAIYAPSSAGQVKAINNAYRLAEVTPDTIELIEAHGTGTRVGDTVEATALSEVYRKSARKGTWCAIGSVKSQIGHTKAAAGAAGLIKAALALHYKVLPPTIKVTQPVEPLQTGRSPFYINVEKRPWIAHPSHPRRAAVSAFGFGGSNFHAVLEEASSEKTDVDWEGNVELLAFHGDNSAAIQKQLRSWTGSSSWVDIQKKAAESRRAFDASAPARLILIIQKDVTDLHRLIENSYDRLAHSSDSSWHHPEGAAFGSGTQRSKVAVLFPGQGSQYVHMLRDLACIFPEMQAVLANANAIFARMEDTGSHMRLTDRIYPFSDFTAGSRSRQENQLRETIIAQPAIGAVSLGALKILESFGLNADAYAGHSYGELPALCAAGCFDEEALHYLSRLRGHLMASFHGQDTGTMLAVHAPLQTIEELLAQRRSHLVIANRNAPQQYVLSGSSSEIACFAELLDKQQIRSTRLPVAAAFHSPFVAPAQIPFRNALDEVEVKPSRRPVFANSSALAYPDDPQAVREILSRQLACPVEFIKQVEHIYKSGVRTFVEVGPGSTLTRLVESILRAKSDATGWEAFALDSSSGKRSGMVDLAFTLARLAASGQPMQLDRWERRSQDRADHSEIKKGLSVAICGANYVKPRSPRPPRKQPIIGVESPREVEIHESAKLPLHTASGAAMSSSPTPAKQDRSPSPNTTVPPTTALGQALEMTQQSLLAFQRLQEQTAQLHRQFLQQQEAAQKTLQMLVEQQQRLLLGGFTGSIPLPAPTNSQPTALTSAPIAPVPQTRPAVAVTPVGIPSPQPRVIAPSPVPPPDFAAPQPTQQVSAAGSARQDVRSVLLAVVAEKTGYPAEMLQPEMSLDADLGIDSIKRVEIMSALQEQLPSAPVVKPEHLGSFHTLQDIIVFLGQGTAEAKVTVDEPSKIPSPARIISPPTSSNEEEVTVVLLSVVAEKTGYPVEMLTPDMSLDSDLGIDSIKRVEILSALQERLPHTPAVKPEQLGSFRTLADIIAVLRGPLTTTMEQELGGDGSQSSMSTDISSKKKEIITADAAPWIPTPRIEPGTPDHAPAVVPGKSGTGVRIDRSILEARPLEGIPVRSTLQIAKKSFLAILGNASSFSAPLAEHLRGTGHQVRSVSWNDDPLSFDPTGIGGLIIVAPESPLVDDFAIRAFRWLKHVGPALIEAAKQSAAFLTGVIQFDGKFGLGDLDLSIDPAIAALCGMIKTAAREWEGVSCKVVDCHQRQLATAVTALCEEIFLVGPTEVGIDGSHRWQLELTSKPVDLLPGNDFLKRDDVVLITGGARGVTAAVALAIARNHQATLVLLGRTPLSEMEPDWLQPRRTEAEIKRALLEHGGARLTPREVDTWYREIIAQREVRNTLTELRAAGSTVYYLAADVRDAVAVRREIAAIRPQIGRFTGFIHGSGVIADRRILDLSESDFQSVYATKVVGFKNVMAELERDPLRMLVLFSSSTGRFGRVGQIAYAAANEVLNKQAQHYARKLPDCRTVAMNWGPWEGGMVNDALRKIFEQEGVGCIPLTRGAECLIKEMTAPDRSVETTIIARPTASTPLPNPEVRSLPGSVLAFERLLRIDDHPILRSHVINHRAVLPMVLHLEWLAHAALHGNPGMIFHGIDQLRILNGVYVDSDKSTPLSVYSGKGRMEQGYLHVPVEIRGKHGTREIVHSRAEVILGIQLPDAPAARPLPSFPVFPTSLEECYRSQLFHGSDLVALRSVLGLGTDGFTASVSTASPPVSWMREPLRGAWLADPLVLDACFQMMILWSFQQHGSGCLPMYLGGFRQYRRNYPREGVQIAGRIVRDNGSVTIVDVDILDASGKIIATIQHVEAVIDPNLNQAFRANSLRNDSTL